MRLNEKVQNQCCICKERIAAIVFWAAILFIIMAALMQEKEIYAASGVSAGKSSSIQASDASIVKFTNNSGKYMVKNKNGWYLKDKNGKALTGIQKLVIPRVDGIFTGFYIFDGKGKLIQKTAVYYFKKQTVENVVFQGYYQATVKGRFAADSCGLVSLRNQTCEGRLFNGIFYRGSYGKLTAPAQIRKLSAQKVGGISISAGYYFFNIYGQLRTVPSFVTMKNRKYADKTFNGTYYFGGKNGMLYRKAGWITYKGERYYLTSTGKRYENCWKQGYYLLSDGRIARSQRVPDGSYVDCDGRKCAKEDMQLSALKKQLTAMTNSYPGTWSVYVKNLKTGDVVNVNEKAMYPASVIKPFVMASTFDQINSKKLSYSSSVKSLLKSMITVSDNEAYNQLVRLNSSSRSFVSGAAAVNSYLKKNGYTKTGCHSTLHPSSSSFTSDGGSNTSSAKDCGVLLEKIYNGTCVSAKYSKEMLNLLLG